MFNVGRAKACFDKGACKRGGGNVLPASDTVAYKREPGIATHGHGPSAHHFEAIFIRWVVAARDHDATVEIFGKGGEVDFLRAAHPHARHIRTCGPQALGKCIVQGGAGKASIVSDDHALCPEFTYKGKAYIPSKLFV